MGLELSGFRCSVSPHAQCSILRIIRLLLVGGKQRGALLLHRKFFSCALDESPSPLRPMQSGRATYTI